MKLYRGIKSRNFSLRTPDEERAYTQKWRAILERREQHDHSYPDDLNEVVIELHKANKLSYQHFTDHREIAERYAHQEGGWLIEIEVPIEDILEYFTLEFQNYPRRRKRFEIVYLVSSHVLSQKAEKWSFTTTNFKKEEGER